MRRPRPVVLAVVVSTFFVGFVGGVVFPILGTIIGISLSTSVDAVVRPVALRRTRHSPD